jgi:pimeloyl-ACP methyl ester carboxylesterase
MQIQWTEGSIVTDSIRIHYTRTGDGSKPSLVLAHGFSDSGLCWLPLAQALETDFDVILPDARGHGLSARVQPEEKIDAAADLAGLIRGLALEKPVVGGHSMGATVAAAMQARFPGLARALVLEDPAWFIPQPPVEGQPQPPRPRHGDWLLTLKNKSVDELVATCHTNSPTWQEAELHPWAESKLQFDLNFMQAPSVSRDDWRETVKALDCPTLLLTANPRKGSIVSPQAAQLARSLNSRIKVVRIPRAGHNIRRENFEAYLQAVRAFLKNL